MRRASIAFLLLLAPLASFAQPPQPVALPQPRTSGGKPLLDALRERKSTREFSPEKLSPQLLSDLLWAAWGINRPDGHRTAPSAMNTQEIDVYVVTADGAFQYDAKGNRLLPVATGDLRAAAGTQPYVATAAVNLLYVADVARTKGSDRFIGADAGFIAQNVYLFCASEGLVAVARASFNQTELAAKLHLTEKQKVVLAQSVGYPVKR
jgi:nitroreductase